MSAFCRLHPGQEHSFRDCPNRCHAYCERRTKGRRYVNARWRCKSRAKNGNNYCARHRVKEALRWRNVTDDDIWPVADRYVRSCVATMGDKVAEKLIQGAIIKVARALQDIRWAQRGRVGLATGRRRPVGAFQEHLTGRRTCTALF